MKTLKIVLIFFILNSCSFNKKNLKKILGDSHQVLSYSEQIDLGSNNNWEYESDTGVKVLIYQNKLLVYKEEPNKKDQEKRYFLHVKLMNSEVLNLDFNFSEFEIPLNSLEERHKNYMLAVVDLPKEPIFSVSIGQFDTNGRIWQTIFHEDQFR